MDADPGGGGGGGGGGTVRWFAGAAGGGGGGGGGGTWANGAAGSRGARPPPATNVATSARVTAQPGDRGSSTCGSLRIRRTRPSNDPPVAATAMSVDPTRHDSSSASARA